MMIFIFYTHEVVIGLTPNGATVSFTLLGTVSCTETGTAARWFLRVSCVEPLAAVPVSVQDTSHPVFSHMRRVKYGVQKFTKNTENARERGEEGEWDEWRRRGNVGPLFFVRPPPSHSFHSPSSPRSRATKKRRLAALPDKTAKENRSERAVYCNFKLQYQVSNGSSLARQVLALPPYIFFFCIPLRQAQRAPLGSICSPIPLKKKRRQRRGGCCDWI
jgi:hypothetical protein